MSSIRDWIKIVEAPISGINTYGDLDTPGSMRPDDLAIMKSPKAKEKTKRILQNIPVDIELHLINLPTWININDHVHDYTKIGVVSLEKFNKAYNMDINFNPNAVNAVYVENEGNQRLPLTPWMIAHRMAHMFSIGSEIHGHELSYARQRNNFFNFIQKIADLYMKKSGSGTLVVEPDYIGHFFGTTKACRNNKLVSIGEFFHECFAQYCVTNTIKFNKAKSDYTVGENVFCLRDQNSTIWRPKPYKEWLPERVTEELNQIDNEFSEISVLLQKKFLSDLQKMVGKILVL